MLSQYKDKYRLVFRILVIILVCLFTTINITWAQSICNYPAPESSLAPLVGNNRTYQTMIEMMKDRFKGIARNLLNKVSRKNLSKEKQLIEEADQQTPAKRIKLPDSCIGFIVRHGDYLRVSCQGATMRWDYLRGPDTYGITRALKILSGLKVLGHGTIGFLNSEDNHDRKIAPGDVDYVAAISLLKIILAGEMKNCSVSEFETERQSYFKLNANYYGPFFVILKPDLKMSDLGDPNNTNFDRFEHIGNQLHHMYLVPRAEDKEFFIHAIKRACKENIITEEAAKGAVLKLKTVAEFVLEESRKQSSRLQKESLNKHPEYLPNSQNADVSQLAAFEKEWELLRLNVPQFLGQLSIILGLEVTLDCNKPVFVFSEKVAFDNNLAKCLPKLTQKGIKVAVIARTPWQQALVDKLNETRPVNEKIIRADRIEAIQTAAIKAKVTAPRFYYFRMKNSVDPMPQEPNINVYELTPDCVFRTTLTTHSGRLCPLIPVDPVHLFRSTLSTS